MAEKLSEFDFKSGGQGRRAVYPWPDWMDGDIWRVTAGEDFTCKVDTFRQQLSTKAKDAGMRVRTRVGSVTPAAGGEIASVVFQFYKEEGDRDGPHDDTAA